MPRMRWLAVSALAVLAAALVVSPVYTKRQQGKAELPDGVTLNMEIVADARALPEVPTRTIYEAARGETIKLRAPSSASASGPAAGVATPYPGSVAPEPAIEEIPIPQTGDILAVTIEPSGWEASITIKGLGTGGTYAFGLGPDNDPTGPYSAKVLFTVSSPGYDPATKAATTQIRTVIGTQAQRRAYPNQTTNDEIVSGSDVICKVVLSDYVFASDTVTVSILGGFYAQGTASRSYARKAVTNLSTESFPKVVGNWMQFDREVVGTSFDVQFAGMHWSAGYGGQGLPLAFVRFTTTDQHGHTTTVDVSALTVIAAPNAGTWPIVVYRGTIGTSVFTPGDVLTVNARAYPLVGDSLSVLDTNDGLHTGLTPNYTSQRYLYDGGALTRKCAVVDSTNGNDGTGAVVDISAFNYHSPPAPFATIAGAVNAIQTSLGGSADLSGQRVYVRAGNHAWMNGTAGAGTTSANAWLEFMAFPNDATPVFDRVSGTRGHAGWNIKLQGISDRHSGANDLTYGNDRVALRKFSCSSSGSSFGWRNNIYYMDEVEMSHSDNIPYSTTNECVALARFVTFNMSGIYNVYTMAGCKDIKAGGGLGIRASFPGQTNPLADGIFIQNCSLSTGASLGGWWVTDTLGLGRGMGWQNVVVESTSNVQPLIQIAGGQSTSDQVNNILFHHCTLAGARFNGAYNDYNLNGVTPPKYRKVWSIVGTYFEQKNHITDVDAHGGSPDGARVGNWAVQRAVAQRGFVDSNPSRLGNIQSESAGILSHVRRAGDAAYDPLFASNKCYGTGDGLGGGDYHLLASSPLKNRVQNTPIGYDIEGNPRDLTLDAAGAFRQ